MACDSCTEYEIPDCIDTLFIDSFFEPGVDYIVTFKNHFGKKTILTKEANYSGLLEFDISDDFPAGYWFKGNTVTFQAYESQPDFECDEPLSLCGYENCITIEVYEADSQETYHTINCCG